MLKLRMSNPFAVAHAAHVLIHRVIVLSETAKMPISITIRPHTIFPRMWVAELGRHNGTGDSPTAAMLALGDHVTEDCA